MAWPGLIEHYRQYMPLRRDTIPVTLLEGNTPLVHAPRLGARLGGIDLYLKYEGLNPTGSFKDRGMTMAMTKALEDGAKAVICASTGNTSASAAAYAARAGIQCYVVIPEGAVALGKLAQALVYGARVLALEGNFDQALALVRQLADENPEIALVNSVNPFRLQGQKTAAFEICDQLGEAPRYLAIPVGNAGNITAYWMGFGEYGRGRPAMLGFQAAGAAPLVKGHPIEKPETIATAIKIGNPASWQGAVNALQESGGQVNTVTDDEIIDAYKQLASLEGVFCEPASAASVAGVINLAAQGFFREGDRVVCVLTGHGLKDPERAIKVSPEGQRIKSDMQELRRVLLGGEARG